MSDADRELRDLLEEAQSELKRARSRLDTLEGIEGDHNMLRHELAAAQAELKAVTDRLAELEHQSTEALEEELDEVSRDRALLRQRLEQADKTREQWDGKLAAREAELVAARAEGSRLREELSQSVQPVAPKRSRRWVALSVLPLLAIALLALLRACH